MTVDHKPKITLIVPCYNEEQNIPLFVQTVQQELADIDWKILFVNDGSRDHTWDVIRQSAAQNPRISGISFSRNFGHQNALKAGFDYCASHDNADACITLDADLQHPIELIPELVRHWKEGARIVQTVRQDQDRRISPLKKYTSRLYYSLFSWISNTTIQPGTADFRLVDRDVLRFVVECGDKELFLRGLLPWSGLRTVMLPYVPHERQYGTSQYTLGKMLKLATAGILGYSVRPLYLALGLGLTATFLSLCYFIYVITVSLIGYRVSIGWPSLMATMLGMGGIQLFVMGIMGLYIGRVVNALNKRPPYLIAETTLPHQSDNA